MELWRVMKWDFNHIIALLKKWARHPKGQPLLLALIFIAVISVFIFLPAPEAEKSVEPVKTLEQSIDTIIDTGVADLEPDEIDAVNDDDVENTYIDPDLLETLPVIGARKDQKQKGTIKIIEKQPGATSSLKENYTLIPPKQDKKRVKIAIVIDDLGMSFARLKKLLALEKELNLAFLPYAPNLEEQTQLALKEGQHLLVHMPMQPKSRSVDTGPIVLQPEMDSKTILKNLKKGLASFSGYKGINNHMGSDFTEYEAGMHLVLTYLKSKGLYFLDSKTTPKSVGRAVAEDVGIPFAERDVFLDHVNELSYIKKQLKQTEHVAFEKGTAIAIGHPYTATIEALTLWVQDLDRKGIELVSLEDLLEKPAPKN